ncbi:hypothetical protein DSCO28_65590 [Desulfosarcina ovata subsp. sediminis]|uniref:HTH gntR-type domain-containing protein n=1 Tax=Desulfosarcina ovata subsp. sediminis TaxID=885957 RepID=A0A5K8A0G2_9BACT|nr:GntR family transcriptional regulator [Desulfosarcina ovata]BBO85993.1 hypothetical protein DSCO28_65590 [Desulfosarcina ovata subsp. sediminis]
MTIKTSEAQHLSSTDFAYQSIQGLILSGKFIAGQRLIYANLEKMLGVSKTPIISALSRLERKGLVSYIKNRGYYVSDTHIKNPEQVGHSENQPTQGAPNGGAISLPLSNDPFAPTSLNSVVYRKIKKLIRTLKVAPGQKLVYSDLEKKFGVSKTPIINALSKLESEGYVYIKKNVGCYVKESQPDEINEVMEARTCLEVSNVDFVMQHLTQADLIHLETLQKRYRAHQTAIFDRTKLIANASFHLHLAQMGRNRFMVRYIRNLYEWLEFRVRLDVLPKERIIKSEDEHDQMIEALHRRDADLLKSLLKKHLTATTQYHVVGRSAG